MKFFLFCTILAFSTIVKPEKLENEENDDSSEDKSVFDRILAVNMKAGMTRSEVNQRRIIQGDIVETDLVKKMMAGGQSRGAATNVIQHLWPDFDGDGYREIPYEINSAISSYTYNIQNAMNEWMEKVPCLRFVRRTNQAGYLHFYSGAGCSSAVGRQGTIQYVSVNTNGCMYHGVIVHEIGHALGFWHEQSRLDRDSYVTINWNKIIPDMKFNFDKVYSSYVQDNIGYDYNSIMHYGPKAFTIDGSDTIVANNGQSIGQRQGLSTKDVQQARQLYCQTTTGGNDCKNNDADCVSLANQGFCTSTNDSYKQWMWINCKKACRLC